MKAPEILFFPFLLLLVCFHFSFDAKAQPPAIQWQYSYGGSDQDDVSSIIRTNDGGYFMAGSSSSSDGDITVHIGGEDFWVMKLDSNGILEWDESFGGSNYDVANAAIQTVDGGYAIAGYTWSNNGDIETGSNHGMDDYWVIKLDNSGGLTWKKTYGGSGIDEAHSIIQTDDEGFLIAGASSSNNDDVSGNHGGMDYWIVKTDGNGTLQWQKSLGGSDDDYATSVVESRGGDFIIAGYTFSNDQDVAGNHGYNDYWIVRLSNAGNMLWEKSYGGSSDDRAFSLIKTGDNGFALAGRTFSNDGDVSGNHGNGDYWIIKLDSTGNLQWQKSYGGNEYDEATSIVQTSDSGYAIAGKSYSSDGDATKNNGGADYWIIKTDSTGSMQWQKSVGGSNDEKMPIIVQSSDGGYVIAGTTSSNDKDVSGNHGLDDYWVVKFSFTAGIDEKNKNESRIVVFPNPATNELWVMSYGFCVRDANIEFYNSLGERILLSQPKAHNRQPTTRIDISSYPNGLYFLRFITKEGIIEKKVVIER